MKQLKNVIFVLLLLLSTNFGAVAQAQTTHWDYEGEHGPLHWGELEPAYALCASGLTQSPIDIASGSPTDSMALTFGYQPSKLTILNNGHTIQAAYDAGSTVIIDDQPYELLQFHFHHASEHTIDGQALPMELHLVHRNSEGELAVIGIFLVEGAENAALAEVFAHMPIDESEAQTIDGVTINAADILPANHSYWRYDGSLTTPPCSEGVKWHVLQTPLEVSAAQLAGYNAIFHNNARPVQAFNERHFITGAAPISLPVTGMAVGGNFAIPLLIGFVTLLALNFVTKIKFPPPRDDQE